MPCGQERRNGQWHRPVGVGATGVSVSGDQAARRVVAEVCDCSSRVTDVVLPACLAWLALIISARYLGEIIGGSDQGSGLPVC